MMKVLHLESTTFRKIYALCGWGCVSGWAHAGTYAYVEARGWWRPEVGISSAPQSISTLFFCILVSHWISWTGLTESPVIFCLCFCSSGTTDTPLPMTFYMDAAIWTQAPKLVLLKLSTNKSHLSGDRHMLLSGIDYSGDFTGNVPNISHLLELLCYEPFGRKKESTLYVRNILLQVSQYSSTKCLTYGWSRVKSGIYTLENFAVKHLEAFTLTFLQEI